MADLVVVGSVALDTVKTPFGAVKEALGGAATYFSYSASFFTQVRLVGTVGDDFPSEHLDLLRQRKVDLAGLQISKGGRTFRWTGEYGYDLNEAKTLDTQLNVFADFKPTLPESFTRAPFLFLANIDPVLQLDVRRQMKNADFVALDTMNFWIQGKRDDLLRVLGQVDALLINDAEARQLAGEANLVKAARAILRMGPKTVVVKRGEYGALMLSEDEFFYVPAYPLESVFDPTGAGDTFAGGVMGYLGSQGRVDRQTIRRAIVYGSVMASFTVEDFSLDRLKRLTPDEVQRRYGAFHDLVRVEF